MSVVVQSHWSEQQYPILERHPEDCDCHPKEYRSAELLAEVESIKEPPVVDVPVDYAAYIASEAWKVKARYYKARALHRCQLCNKRGGPEGQGLDAHHRTYVRLGAELDLDVIVLCRECHARHHGAMEAA